MSFKNNYLSFLQKLKRLNSFKKYLPLLLLLLGVAVFGGVAFQQLYQGGKSEKVKNVSQLQSSNESSEAVNGDVAGIQEESSSEITPTSQVTVKNQSTPTKTPEVKSDNGGQNNNTSNQNSNSNNNTTTVVITATSTPTNTSTPINTPTVTQATPTSDTSPFEASITCNYSGNNVSYEIQANKPIATCSGDWSRGCGITTHSGSACNCSGSTCSNYCNQLSSSSGPAASVNLTVGSATGETKQLACNP